MSFLMAEYYSIVYTDHIFFIHSFSIDTEAPSTVWLLWTLLHKHRDRGVPAFHCICIFFYNKFIFIGVQFANIQNNTQCSSRQVPPSVPVTHSPHRPPSSPSTTPSSFPRVRSLSCSVSLSDISHTFLLPSLIFPFTIIYIPHINETI